MGRILQHRGWGFLIILLVMLAGCKSDDDVLPPTNVIHIPSALYFQATIDGVPYTLGTDEGSYSNVTSYNIQADSAELGQVDLISTFSRPSSPQATIEFRNFYYGDTVMTDQDFMAIFGIGRRDFYLDADTLTPGIILSWRNEAGKVWRSHLIEQANGIFNVDQNEFGINSFTSTATLSISFSCTLADEQGSVIQVEQGKGVIFFSKPVF